MPYDTKQITRGRERKGWSKCRLAKAAGVDPKTITRIERGESLKPETIKAVADVLGLKIERLVIEEAVSEKAS